MQILQVSLPIIAIFPILGVPADAEIITAPYSYSGGTFSLTTVFNFYTSVETDGTAGTTRFPPVVTITNTVTRRSVTVSYISPDDYVVSPKGNMLVGKDVIPGRQDLRTNTGTAVIDASSLGSGPLVFRVTGTSELSGPALGGRNVYGGPFYVWTISPQSIAPNLPLYKLPGNNPSPPNPRPGPVLTNIHAVIISGDQIRQRL
jgi:hypothetical protein